MKRPSVILLGVVFLIISLITPFFSGCVENAQVDTPRGLSDSYQDAELLSIGADSGRTIGSLISRISKDASVNDISSLETDSARLSSLAGNYYFQMKDLNVSQKYQAWKTNYLLGLLDVQTAGDYFSKSASSARSEDYKTALTYLQQGNTLFQRSSTYIRMANESVSAL